MYGIAFGGSVYLYLYAHNGDKVITAHKTDEERWNEKLIVHGYELSRRHRPVELKLAVPFMNDKGEFVVAGSKANVAAEASLDKELKLVEDGGSDEDPFRKEAVVRAEHLTSALKLLLKLK